eukprot:CAMPEP_0171152606 /NCGR_PEP_ID=MMETSP0766_2-20121228/150655_1 /TAXON_ID=439317 /ORGANISM="Gambierdiscus australes, Strain CAWD 149" /LENGTH=73 /DNA_ID=CAMNT_0011616521 /DNA_START=656 /DNA_END=875 /DNA_ORIENTATION=+
MMDFLRQGGSGSGKACDPSWRRTYPQLAAENVAEVRAVPPQQVVVAARPRTLYRVSSSATASRESVVTSMATD